MPIRHSIIHQIDKKPDGTPAVLHVSSIELVESQATENLINDLNVAYNAKARKGWGFFHPQSGAFPLSGWLQAYLNSGGFIEFSTTAVEHLTKLMEESNLSVGGHVLLAHYQQGINDYLVVALLQHSESVTVNADLSVTPSKHLDFGNINLAARINISEWRSNPKSRQYISYLKGLKGRKATDYFRDFIGCQEGVDGPGETRTLLKAFSDFVAAEDWHEDSAREKTHALVSYSLAQAKIGEPITLDDLSELIDEDRPKAFYDFSRSKDYGLSAEIPADKRTLNQFRRFTGRTDGLSISFEAHMLGSKVEFNKAAGTLMLRGLPPKLTDQLKRASV
ncbi:nucleoid-associated protein YejK [Pseudomonas helleri]|uniref:Nucleoid-associated protein YejK n=1 Tax=Pseudomonas helleri TaxID=1608996 RepID=A0A7X2CE49_9PSED|nr:nucleoid-associated protein YejK [Pseudomonas helleri]MQU28067.1 nucleoid-associated protein YejK [Pseudomonas helleri]